MHLGYSKMNGFCLRQGQGLKALAFDFFKTTVPVYNGGS